LKWKIGNLPEDKLLSIDFQAGSADLPDGAKGYFELFIAIFRINKLSMRLLLIISFCLSIFAAMAQGNGKPGKITKYIGKYEANGMVAQVVLLKKITCTDCTGSASPWNDTRRDQ
jgi:hypothetical protein